MISLFEEDIHWILGPTSAQKKTKKFPTDRLSPTDVLSVGEIFSGYGLRQFFIQTEIRNSAGGMEKNLKQSYLV
jgi:hypothetical protein